MPSTIRNIQFTLVLLSSVATYFTWGLLYKNGSLDLLDRIRAQNPPLFPSTKAVLKTTFTGIAPIDHLLTTLTIVFSQVLDGSFPSASLQAFHFGGQYMAAWGLVVLEGIRTGNRGKLITYGAIFGLLCQSIAFTICAPLFFALYLSTSPIVRPTIANVSPHVASTVAIPVSLVLGFFIPSILMCLPAPSVVSFETHQNFIALWQPFPVWVALCQQLLGRLFESTGMTDKVKTLSALRSVYLFLVLFAGYTHVSTVAAILLSVFFPGLFASNYVGAFNAWTVFIPGDMTGSVKIQDVGPGIHLFLQYDEIIGSTALLIWATILYVRADSRQKAFDKWPQLVVAMSFLMLLTGPSGCAVTLLWARDELILDGNKAEPKKLK